MNRTLRIALAIGFTQILGWGSTYFLPSTLGAAMAADLGVSTALVWGGVTLLFTIRGALSPWAGAAMDRHGVRPFLLAAPPLFAAGLTVIGLAQGPVGYLCGWALIGIGAPLSLGPASFATMAEIAGRDARRPMTVLMLVSGFSSTAAFPITAWLQAQYGWRTTCFVFAAVQLLVSLPIQAWMVPPRPRREPVPWRLNQSHAALSLPLGLMLLLGLGMALDAWLISGVLLHLIGLLRSLGASAEQAVWIGALTGPAQVAARMADYWIGARASPIASGIAAGLLHLGGIALLIAGGGELWPAIGFALLFGAGNGLTTIVHAAAPLALFGPERYGTAVGRLQLPKDAMNAVSPVFLAIVLDVGGPPVMLWSIVAISLGSLATMLVLLRQAGAVRA